MSERPVWFVTGASRGFGLAVALDVSDEAAAEAAVAAAVAHFGRRDVLVNNAGYGLIGAVEEVSDAEARELFDVNVFGLLKVTRAALPPMRAQGSGRIVNISSVAGIASGPGSGVYSASKYAVEGISEAQRAELEPLGVLVTVVEPGVFRTGFLDPSSLRAAAQSIPDYAISDRRGWAEAENGNQAGDPAKAAATIVELARSERPPLRLPLGADCVGRIEAKIERFEAELGAWRDVALRTDFEVADGGR